MIMRRLNPLVTVLLVAFSAAFSQTKTVEVDKNQSSITYKMEHPLHHIEAVSKDGWFRVEVDPAKKEIKSVSAQVDVMTFDSGNSNRDSHAMEVIESIKYPDVTFLSSGIRQSGDSIFVSGKLTFHGVTNDIEMVGTTKWSDGRLLVQGGFDLSLTAFRIQRPALLMIPVEDALRFTLTAGFAL
jgi:polyisoprenoid-binding protein YceI